MYRSSRQLHRWIGIVSALFLAVIAVTGFLLANKARIGWLRPPEVQAQEVAGAREVVSVHTVTNAAIALGDPHLLTMKDIDRVDYRPKSNIFKVVSKDGYREVQVDGATGKVLSHAARNDQLVEDIHDLSFFADWTHALFLPLVALALLGLAVSGIGLFLTPVYRRWTFRRGGGVGKKGN